jgi:arylsulfatase A-like enzyme
MRQLEAVLCSKPDFQCRLDRKRLGVGVLTTPDFIYRMSVWRLGTDSMLDSGKVGESLSSGKRGLWIASRWLVSTVIVYLGTTADAQAYVDPNAAGLLFQILTPILAVIAAAWAALRLWSVQWFGVIRAGFGGFSAVKTDGEVLTRRFLMWRLWGSLLTIAVTFSVLDCIIYILSASDGWLTFLRPGEAALSVAWHFAISIAEGCVLGTFATLVVLPVFAIRSDVRRGRAVQLIIALALVGCFLVLGWIFLRLLFQWAAVVGLGELSSTTRLAVMLVFVCIIGALLGFSRSRATTLRSLKTAFDGRMTRRALLATGAGAAAAALLDSRFAAPSSTAIASVPTPANAQNIVLITFDALGAEHMSLYGSALPTTPNLEAFARTATTFTNFFACSTFTTPSIAACMTGRYPSETQVYHLNGFLRGRAAERNFVRELRSAGYATAASVTNPYAHPDRLGIGEDFLLRPAPPQIGHPLSGALLHARDPLVAKLVRRREAFALRQFDRIMPMGSEFPPERSFAQARGLLKEIGSHRPFFLWVHVYAPHAPYRPAPPDLYRFFPGHIPRASETDIYNRASFRYDPSAQPMIDQQHLRYSEFVAECDRAFRDFLTFLDTTTGPETAVVVSADHGESFTGGVFTHGGPDQVRQIVNIPLIIRSARHKAGDRVSFAADQTSLAPTILELAGLPRPSWMRSPALFAGDNAASRTGGEAFTQYFERNSIFEPIQNGTVGIIDGVDQFVVDLETRKGILRPLAEADTADADRSRENPALAAELRRRIFARFPNLSDDVG